MAWHCLVLHLIRSKICAECQRAENVVNDGTVIRGGWSRIAGWRCKPRDRAEATVTRLRPISTWLLILAVVVILAVTWPLTAWLYGIAGNDPARQIEAIKTGLTVAAGTGGAFALLLAFRRQRSTEIIATETREAREREHEQRDRAADASERDAEQRRITELYTKAADQLGSEKAPVRLAGLHALERLAQSTPGQQQTIVDVICAYLRMPYTPPDDQPPAEDAPAKAHTRYENRRQELQVRLTAQRILGAHLRPEAADAFWPGIDLNLAEAHLYEFDLHVCQVRTVQFDGAMFAGNAEFEGAQFTGHAGFDGARFTGNAGFRRTQFTGNAGFHGTRFTGSAGFDGARFTGPVVFSEARFTGLVGFPRAQFTGSALFHAARFTEYAYFNAARFTEYAYFNAARFTGGVWFDEVRFTEGVGFDGARVASSQNVFLPAGWTIREAAEEEEEGWMYLVRVEDGGEQPNQEDRSDGEAGTSGT